MTITHLTITDFRNMQTVQLAPQAFGLNLVFGNNGSGKTSLLEAIHYLGLGRSFRTSTSTRLIRHTTNKFAVFAQLMHQNRQIPLGTERDLQGLSRFRVAENDATVAEIATFLPLRLIHSNTYNLLEAGPAFRRKYLDWGLFYQADNFFTCWRTFERALKQRNILLKQGAAKATLASWTDELVRRAEPLHQFRCQYVQLLTPVLIKISEELIPLPDLAIHYNPGWAADIPYAEALEMGYKEDLRTYHTQNGPHRADLEITSRGVPIKHFLSRGQQKLLVCAMIVAQGDLLLSQTHKSLVYLVDDLPSELDEHSRSKLLALLAKQQTQLFITAIEKEAIFNGMNKLDDVPRKVFHVEHGNFAEKASR